MILLMFGPLHGTTYEGEVNGPDKRALIVVEPMEVGYHSYQFGEPSPASEKIKYHRYERVEGFSSDNGEDCELYQHTSNCCERGVTSEQLDKQTEDRARRREQLRSWQPERDIYPATNRGGVYE